MRLHDDYPHCALRRLSCGDGVAMRIGRAQKQCGLALIIVLWTAAIITLLASGFTFALRTEARLAADAVQRAQAAAAAEAGISWLMRELLVPSPEALEADATLSFHDFEVALQVLPENAKIDLNAAPEKLLGRLIANTIDELNLDAVDAVAITDALLDWRDADSARRARGAESAEYVDGGRSNGPRNGALLSVSELNQIMGLEPALFRALKPLVTVHARSTRVAPLSASARVLRAVPGLSYLQVEQFVANRGELDNAGQAIRELSGGARYLARSQSTVFTLSAHARSASGVSAQRRAVVKINGNLTQPVSILAWYEDVDLDSEPVSLDQGNAEEVSTDQVNASQVNTGQEAGPAAAAAGQ